MPKKVENVQDKAITRTVSITPKDLEDITLAYGTLTKGVKLLAQHARLHIQQQLKSQQNQNNAL